MFNNKFENKTELLNQVLVILQKELIDDPVSESQIIIAYSAKKNTFHEVDLKNINLKIIENIILERIKGKPLSKIINQKGFWKDIFYTNENTLDPRADTEVIVENILYDYDKKKSSKFKFLDLCSGTGCIGISLLNEFHSASCDFIDISKDAIEVCKKNIDKFQLNSRAKCYESDLFIDYENSKLQEIDFIVCNPPYIPIDHYEKLNPETLHDPRISLIGGVKGTELYEKIINHLIHFQFKGNIYFEIDPIISEKLIQFLLEKEVKIVYKKEDYLKLDRLLKITLSS